MRIKKFRFKTGRVFTGSIFVLTLFFTFNPVHKNLSHEQGNSTVEVKSKKKRPLPYANVDKLARYKSVYTKKCNEGCHTIQVVSEKLEHYTSVDKVDFLIKWMRGFPKANISDREAAQIEVYLRYEGLFNVKCNGCHTQKMVKDRLDYYAKKRQLDFLVNWMYEMPNSDMNRRHAIRIVNYLKARYQVADGGTAIQKAPVKKPEQESNTQKTAE